MANRAYLLAVQDKTATLSHDPEHEILAEGINEIPVFWASLFVREDRILDTYRQSDGGSLQIPNWCVRTEVAQERLARLEEPIGRLLDAKSKGIWSKWVKHIATVRSAYLKTNAAEVWDLDPAGYDKYWDDLLRLFAEPSSDHLAEAVRANELTFANGAIHWQDAEATACKLAGAPHIREVPWLSDLPEADPPSAEDLERKRQYEQVMNEAQQQLAKAEQSQKILKVTLIVCASIALALVMWYLAK